MMMLLPQTSIPSLSIITHTLPKLSIIHHHPCLPLSFPFLPKIFNQTVFSSNFSKKKTMKQQQQQQICLQRNSSCSRSTRRIIPSSYARSTSPLPDYTRRVVVLAPNDDDPSPSPNSNSSFRHHFAKLHPSFSSLLRSVFSIVSFLPIAAATTTCKFLSIRTPPKLLSLTPPLGRKVTGTLFGHRRGYVSFSVQDDPRSDPVLLLELSISTATLVKEMASGLVRIALECEKPRRTGGVRAGKLFNEPKWTMYCNGRNCGYAVPRVCTESDCHVLGTVQRVSVGAGIIPVVGDGRKSGGGEGELLYMRAKFERVVGSRDSEAFYMMNPDGATGGPELGIFLLRI